jgi:transcriptional regulator with XRE-family HTH domain
MSDGRRQGDKAGLRDFLLSRRARVTPDRVGLDVEGRARRVPGLRREEVAQLAGVSVDYYTRLERGRNLNVSDSVLDALARALCLTATEREHLYAVARPDRKEPVARPRQRGRLAYRQVLDSLTDCPALILGNRLDVLASNHLARSLYTDFDTIPARDRNMARFVFLDQDARDLYADWPAAARSVVAALNLYAGRHPRDPLLAELIGDLSLQDPDFRRWWADHDVHRHTHGSKQFHHPLVGDLTLEYVTFAPTDDPDQILGIDVAEPGSRSAEALRLLADWTAPAEAAPEQPARTVQIDKRPRASD